MSNDAEEHALHSFFFFNQLFLSQLWQMWPNVQACFRDSFCIHFSNYQSHLLSQTIGGTLCQWTEMFSYFRSVLFRWIKSTIWIIWQLQGPERPELNPVVFILWPTDFCAGPSAIDFLHSVIHYQQKENINDSFTILHKWGTAFCNYAIVNMLW